MSSKRKSVTFHDDVSTVYPECFDGTSSPVPINSALETTPASLQLDPMYLDWLRLATIAQYPFIVNGTFASHVYHQNFDEHTDLKNVSEYYRKVLGMTQEEILARQRAREAAVPALAEKYGSLGWGGLYVEVSKEAWVKNYRVGAPSCILGRTRLLTMTPDRRSTDFMARTSSCWKRSQRPLTKSVPSETGRFGPRANDPADEALRRRSRERARTVRAGRINVPPSL